MKELFKNQGIHDLRSYKAEHISNIALNEIILGSKKIRMDILSMIHQAGSGHVGGALSSADIFLILWLCANVTPGSYGDTRDRVVISHGHTSAALYAVLGNLGFFDIQEAVKNYRRQESIFEGHPNSSIPGIEWCSGSLGQGLSVGCGFALASKLRKQNYRVYVVMGDGEQQKGQITEAREFAAKYHLSNLTAIVDVNRLQASGDTVSIMPSDIRKKYESSGWEVISVDGHNFQEIYHSLKVASVEKKTPCVILANTVMGKGVSFIENNHEYHGRVLSATQYEQAIHELGGTDMEISIPIRFENRKSNPVECFVKAGKPAIYQSGDSVECRAAAGAALYELLRHNTDIPIAVLDADLSESLRTEAIARDFPDNFIQCGIQEHNAITVLGALSKSGILAFFPSFGVFGIDETYGQNRMNDINNTSVKLICTHCGLDVGEDGKTHQCIDYFALINNLPGYRLIVPADANQTDRVIRYIASTPGNFVIALGRSPIPVLDRREGGPFYSEDYAFIYGNSEWVREGNDASIISTGTLVHMAVRASDALRTENIDAAVINISCPKELDLETIKRACNSGIVITYEDHLVQSGLGNMVASMIAKHQLKCNFNQMGITGYGKSCTAGEQYKYQRLDIESLQQTIRLLIKQGRAI